jgi:hypothetical protein
MRVMIEFPLIKPLMSTLTVRIKGRGAMSIMLRYENIPHFCFACGHLGHATMNCGEEMGQRIFSSGRNYGHHLQREFRR